jgi:hypothetical protein
MEDSEAIETRRSLLRQLEERSQEIQEKIFKIKRDQELNNSIITHLREINPDYKGKYEELFGPRRLIIKKLEELNSDLQAPLAKLNSQLETNYHTISYLRDITPCKLDGIKQRQQSRKHQGLSEET